MSQSDSEYIEYLETMLLDEPVVAALKAMLRSYETNHHSMRSYVLSLRKITRFQELLLAHKRGEMPLHPKTSYK